MPTALASGQDAVLNLQFLLPPQASSGKSSIYDYKIIFFLFAVSDNFLLKSSMFLTTCFAYFSYLASIIEQVFKAAQRFAG
jgi:hypothetical protein